MCVVSDDKGRYAFPPRAWRPAITRSRSAPSAISSTAPAAPTWRAGQDAAADLKLRKAKEVPRQLSNAEWLPSIPGTDDQKKFLLGCVSCHTLQRIVASTHDAAEFAQVFGRMTGYYPGSTPIHPQRLVGDFRRNISNGADLSATAKYLASINLSERSDLGISAEDSSRARPGAATKRHRHRI